MYFTNQIIELFIFHPQILGDQLIELKDSKDFFFFLKKKKPPLLLVILMENSEFVTFIKIFLLRRSPPYFPK